MSIHELANCKSCNRVFVKTHDERCSDCMARDDRRLESIRLLLARSRSKGGVNLDDLARLVDMPPDELEQWFRAGTFGPDSKLIKRYCPRCDGLINLNEVSLDERFCGACCEALANELGTEVQSKEKLDDPFKRERLFLEEHEHASKRHFGLKRSRYDGNKDYYKF